MGIMSSTTTAIQRWGGILVRPRATLEALGANEGKYDWWWLAGLFVLGSQIQHLIETVARYQAFRSFLLLINGLAIALLTPLLVGMIVESLVGAPRARYRNLPLVALVVVATLANLLRQQGVEIPGPRYMPEIVGTLWAAGLGLWIRKAMPVPSLDAEFDEFAVTAENSREVRHD